MKILFILFAVWVYCIITNLYWFIKSKRLYSVFLSGKNTASYIPEIDELFNKANTSYQTIYDENKGGYNQRSLVPVAYICDKKRYHFEVDKVFQVTIGTFRLKLKHSIFPIHLLFLPSYIIESKNIVVASFLKIVLTIIYWIISTLAAYHLEVLLDAVYLDYLQKLFERIL